MSLGSLTISVLLSLCSVSSLRNHRVSEVYSLFFSCSTQVIKMRRILKRAWYSSDRLISHLLWSVRVLIVRARIVRAWSARVLNELTNTNDFFRVFVQLIFQILLFLFVSTFSRVAEAWYEIDPFCFFFLEHGVEFRFCVRIITLVLDLNLVICIVWDDN